MLVVKIYFVYVLFCYDGTFYVGITNDLERRLAEHSMGISKTAYTYKRRPVKLVHASDFREVEDAIRWEKQLKGWSHAKKRALVDGDWDAIRSYAKGGGGASTSSA